MRSSETGGPRTKNSSQRRSTFAAGGPAGGSGSHFLCVADELIERFAPSIVKAHLLMSLAAVLVSMHSESAVFCPASARLECDDRRKRERVGALARWTIAGCQGNGPNKLFVFEDLEIAADVREVLSFGRAHHKAKNAAGAQIDLAIHRRPGRRREPLLDVLRHGPRSPDEFRWNVDDAFEKQVEERIGFNVEAGHGSLLQIFQEIVQLVEPALPQRALLGHPAFR